MNVKKLLNEKLLNIIQELDISDISDILHINSKIENIKLKDLLDTVKSLNLFNVPNYEERILSIESEEFESLFKDLNGIYFEKKIVSNILSYIKNNCISDNRYIYEYSPQYRQIIIQFIIRYNNRFFLARKRNTSCNNEIRLLSKLGFIGGHLNSYFNLNDELFQETNITESDINYISNVGVIKLNAEVGNVTNEHLGLLYLVDLNNDSIDINEKEKDKLYGEWYDLKELVNVSNPDSWTKLIIDNINKICI